MIREDYYGDAWSWLCITDHITDTVSRLSFLLREGEPVSTEITFSIPREVVVISHVSDFNWIATRPSRTIIYSNYTRWLNISESRCASPLTGSIPPGGEEQLPTPIAVCQEGNAH